MNIIKRNGEENRYKGSKIIKAVSKANQEVPEESRLSDLQIQVIEERVRKTLETFKHTPTIEEIQDLVIWEIMRQQAYRVAQLNTEYR